jgi:hypothetical protein
MNSDCCLPVVVIKDLFHFQSVQMCIEERLITLVLRKEFIVFVVPLFASRGFIEAASWQCAKVSIINFEIFPPSRHSYIKSFK